VLDSFIEDPKCKEVEEQLRISPTVVPNFTLVNGILRHKGKILIGSTTNHRARLIESFHNSALGGALKGKDHLHQIEGTVLLARNERSHYLLCQVLSRLPAEQV
jgi:hypothetical protein